MNKYKAIFIPGCHYHIYNHAIAFENLFKDPDNYSYFILRMYDHLSEYAEIVAYCLMPNHYHALIKIKPFTDDVAEANGKVLQALGNFHNGYAKAINKRKGRKGRLFQSTVNRRYVPKEIYLPEAIRYIRMNPVKHGFCEHADEWPHTWVDSSVQAA